MWSDIWMTSLPAMAPPRLVTTPNGRRNLFVRVFNVEFFMGKLFELL